MARISILLLLLCIVCLTERYEGVQGVDHRRIDGFFKWESRDITYALSLRWNSWKKEFEKRIRHMLEEVDRIKNLKPECEEAYDIFYVWDTETFTEGSMQCRERGGHIASKEVLGFGAVGNKYFPAIQGALESWHPREYDYAWEDYYDDDIDFKNVTHEWNPYWIGLSDFEEEGVFRWVNDGSLYEPNAAVEKFKWKCENITDCEGSHDGRSINYAHRRWANDQNCVAVTADGVMLNVGCRSAYRALCQRRKPC